MQREQIHADFLPLSPEHAAVQLVLELIRKITAAQSPCGQCSEAH